MKLSPLRIIALCFSSAVIFSGCSKTKNDITKPTPASDAHVYGLIPMQPSDWQNIPVFSRNVLFNSQEGINYSGTPPTSYLLISPQVRDQGQIGSCTGFCGTETNEIIKYENNPSNTIKSTSVTSYTNANGLSTALGFEIPNTSQYGKDTALSPLFLYYVERVIIMGGTISTDGGAYMVNICQALQGLTNNTGTGTQVGITTTTTKVRGKTVTTTSGSPYAGESIETDYPYPWALNPSTGMNIANSTSSAFLTAPSAAAIANAFNYEIAMNPSNSSTSNSTGITTGGYYVINPKTIINDAEMAISSNLPVMMGFSVYEDRNPSSPTFNKYFERLGASSNYVYNPLNSSGNVISTLTLMGGHAVPLIGYITNSADPSIPSAYGGGVFIVENSWGTPWGYNGYFYLPFSVLTSTSVVQTGSLYVLVK